MSRNLSPLEMLTALIENEIDYLEPEELAQTIIDAGFISIYDNVPKQIAEHLAHEMECIISTGDVAESSAYVDGETGRAEAVSARDSLYEEPHEWVRSYAKTMGDMQDPLERAYHSMLDAAVAMGKAERAYEQALAEEKYQYGVTYTGLKHGGQHIEWVESTGDTEWDKETLQLLVKRWKKRGQSPKIVRRRVSQPEVISE